MPLRQEFGDFTPSQLPPAAARVSVAVTVFKPPWFSRKTAKPERRFGPVGKRKLPTGPFPVSAGGYALHVLEDTHRACAGSRLKAGWLSC